MNNEQKIYIDKLYATQDIGEWLKNDKKDTVLDALVNIAVKAEMPGLIDWLSEERETHAKEEKRLQKIVAEIHGKQAKNAQEIETWKRQLAKQERNRAQASTLTDIDNNIKKMERAGSDLTTENNIKSTALRTAKGWRVKCSMIVKKLEAITIPESETMAILHAYFKQRKA